MTRRTTLGLAGLATGGLAIAVAVLLAILGSGTPVSLAQQPQATPGASMGLRADTCTDSCTFPSGATFKLDVLATDLPPGGFGGFQSEIYFPGFTYHQTTCNEEVKIQPLGLCLGPALGEIDSQLHHGATTAVPIPLPVPASTSEVLVEISLTCAADGTHEIWLSTYPGSPLGSFFSDVNTNEVYLTTVGTRTVTLPSQGEPLAVPMADILNVTCGQASPGGEPTTPPGVLPPTGGTLSPAQATAAQATATHVAEATKAAKETAIALGTPFPTDEGATPASGGGDDDDDGLSTGAWIGIIIAIVAVVGAAAGGGWWYYRQRAAQGPTDGGDSTPGPSGAGDATP